MAVEAGTYGSSAKGKLFQMGKGGLDALDAFLDLGGVSTELLAESERHCIHQVSAADLDDILEFIGFLAQGGFESLEGRKEFFGELGAHGDVDGSGGSRRYWIGPD